MGQNVFVHGERRTYTGVRLFSPAVLTPSPESFLIRFLTRLQMLPQSRRNTEYAAGPKVVTDVTERRREALTHAATDLRPPSGGAVLLRR